MKWASSEQHTRYCSSLSGFSPVNVLPTALLLFCKTDNFQDLIPKLLQTSKMLLQLSDKGLLLLQGLCNAVFHILFQSVQALLCSSLACCLFTLWGGSSLDLLQLPTEDLHNLSLNTGLFPILSFSFPALPASHFSAFTSASLHSGQMGNFPFLCSPETGCTLPPIGY